MADDRLTAFLVDLCINKEDLLDQFKTEDGRKKALMEPSRQLSAEQITAFTFLSVGDMKAMIGTQQGGGGGREREANALAKKAAALADEAKAVAKSAKVLAKSIGKAKKKNKKKSAKKQ